MALNELLLETGDLLLLEDGESLLLEDSFSGVVTTNFEYRDFGWFETWVSGEAAVVLTIDQFIHYTAPHRNHEYTAPQRLTDYVAQPRLHDYSPRGR